MADELIDKKLNQSQVNDLMAPMELDLTAFFKIAQNEILSDAEGKITPEKFIDQVVSYFEKPKKKVRKDIKIKKVFKAAKAKAAYLSHYDRPGFFSEMYELSMDEFKEKLGQRKGQKLVKSFSNKELRGTKNITVIGPSKIICKLIKELPVRTRRERKDGVYKKQENGKLIKIKKRKKEDVDNKMSKKQKSRNQKLTIEIETNEDTAKESLLPILEKLQQNGDIGHSHSIIIDPEDENEKFGFDGDGSHRIDSIKVKKSKLFDLIGKTMDMLKDRLR